MGLVQVVMGAKGSYTADEYTNKELREMIGDLNSQMSAFGEKFKNNSEKLDQIIKNQESFIEHCRECRTCVDAAIEAVDTKITGKNGLTDRIIKNEKDIGYIKKAIAAAGTIVLTVAGWLYTHPPKLT